MSAQTITNRLRVLAIANNTKAQYPGNISQSSPLISTINCNVGFRKLIYTANRKECCVPRSSINNPCNLPPLLNGGGPSSIPSYFVNGGLPSSNPTCYIKSEICGFPLSMDGGNPSSIASYFANGGLPSSNPTCYVNSDPCRLPTSINGGNPSSISSYFVSGGSPSSNHVCSISGGT